MGTKQFFHIWSNFFDQMNYAKICASMPNNKDDNGGIGIRKSYGDFPNWDASTTV